MSSQAKKQARAKKVKRAHNIQRNNSKKVRQQILSPLQRAQLREQLALAEKHKLDGGTRDTFNSVNGPHRSQ